MRDIGWAAGLFEGEGCISFGVSRRSDRLQTGETKTYEYGQVRLTLSMTDEDIVRSFHDIVGVGSVSLNHPPSKQKLGNKPQWAWNASGKQAEQLVWRLMPYLGPRRQEQFFEAKRKVNSLGDEVTPETPNTPEKAGITA